MLEGYVHVRFTYNIGRQLHARYIPTFVRGSMPDLHLCSWHWSTRGVVHNTLHKQIDLIGRSDITEQRKDGVGDEEGTQGILL